MSIQQSVRSITKALHIVQCPVLGSMFLFPWVLYSGIMASFPSFLKCKCFTLQLVPMSSQSPFGLPQPSSQLLRLDGKLCRSFWGLKLCRSFWSLKLCRRFWSFKLCWRFWGFKLCRRFWGLTTSSCAGGRRQECGVSLLLQKPAFPSFLPSGGETSIGRSTFWFMHSEDIIPVPCVFVIFCLKDIIKLARYLDLGSPLLMALHKWRQPQSEYGFFHIQLYTQSSRVKNQFCSGSFTISDTPVVSWKRCKELSSLTKLSNLSIIFDWGFGSLFFVSSL